MGPIVVKKSNSTHYFRVTSVTIVRLWPMLCCSTLQHSVKSYDIVCVYILYTYTFIRDQRAQLGISLWSGSFFVKNVLYSFHLLSHGTLCELYFTVHCVYEFCIPTTKEFFLFCHGYFRSVVQASMDAFVEVVHRKLVVWYALLIQGIIYTYLEF